MSKEIWERDEGHWIECREAQRVLDDAFGDGNGLPALFRRMALDLICVRAAGWHYWAADGAWNFQLVRRVVLRSLSMSDNAKHAAEQVEIEQRDAATGDFSGKIYLDDTWEGNYLCDGEGMPRYVLWAITGLQFRQEDIEQSFNLKFPDQPDTPKIELPALRDWIGHCPTDNSKEAYKLLRNQFGKATPKRDDVFMPTWREEKGNPGRGRRKKSPD